MGRHKAGRFFRSNLHMPKQERFAYLRQMTDALVAHERIETTVHRARTLIMWVEPMIAWGKRITYYNKNRRSKFVLQHKIERKFDRPETLEKLFNELVPRYKYRNGGFLRHVKTRIRMRDDAKMAYIEFIDRPGEIRAPKPIPKTRGEFSAEHWASVKRFLGPELAPEEYDDLENLGKRQRAPRIPWWKREEKKRKDKQQLQKQGKKVEKIGDAYALTNEGIKEEDLPQQMLWKHAFAYVEPSTLGDAFNARYSDLEEYIKKQQVERKKEIVRKKKENLYEWEKSFGYPANKRAPKNRHMRMTMGKSSIRTRKYNYNKEVY